MVLVARNTPTCSKPSAHARTRARTCARMRACECVGPGPVPSGAAEDLLPGRRVLDSKRFEVAAVVKTVLGSIPFW